MNQLNVRLESFEGPLPLLIHLIEKNKIDIYDIPIALLTEQYLEYIDSFSARDMESISEFLVMAATLLEIKSKMLLPSRTEPEGEESDPREELVNRLIEYKRFKKVSEELAKMGFGNPHLYKKPQNDLIEFFVGGGAPDIWSMLDGITPEKLFEIFNDTLNRRELKIDRIRSGFNSVKKDLYTIEDKIKYITDKLTVRKRISFTEIFEASADRFEQVVTFLALLELIRLKEVSVRQRDLFGDISIRSTDIKKEVTL